MAVVEVAEGVENESTPTRCGRWVLEAPTFYVVSAGYALAIVFYGWKPDTSVAQLVRIARDPFTNSLTESHHFYESPLSPLLAHYLGVPTWDGFGLIQVAFNFAVILGVAALVARTVNQLAARLLVVGFFASPESQMAVFTYGRLDVLTIGAGTAFMVGPAWLLAPVGAVAGFHHFEQASVVLLVAAALRCGIWRQSPRPLLAGAAGLLVGKLGVITYLRMAGIDATGERAGWLDQAFMDGAGTLWHGRLPLLVFTVLHVLWVPVLWMARHLPRRDRFVLVAVIVGTLLVTLATYDLTRVWANLSWPVVVFAAVWFSRNAAWASLQRWVGWLLLAAFLVPRVHIFWHEVAVTRW